MPDDKDPSHVEDAKAVHNLDKGARDERELDKRDLDKISGGSGLVLEKDNFPDVPDNHVG